MIRSIDIMNWSLEAISYITIFSILIIMLSVMGYFVHIAQKDDLNTKSSKAEPS